MIKLANSNGKLSFEAVGERGNLMYELPVLLAHALIETGKELNPLKAMPEEVQQFVTFLTVGEDNARKLSEEIATRDLLVDTLFYLAAMELYPREMFDGKFYLNVSHKTKMEIFEKLAKLMGDVKRYVENESKTE